MQNKVMFAERVNFYEAQSHVFNRRITLHYGHSEMINFRNPWVALQNWVPKWISYGTKRVATVHSLKSRLPGGG